MYNFKCLSCSGSKLRYGKWIKCDEDVLVHQEDDFIEYINQQIDDNNVLGADCRFICGSCGEPPMLYGDYITTEDELNDYLKMSLEERAEMQADFEQMLNEEAKIEEKLLEDEELI